MKSLDAVIEAFSSWDRPWRILEHVRQSPELSPEERATFQDAWVEALDEHHWRPDALGEGCEAAFKSLRNRFPQLHEETVAAIVRAASFQWR